MLAATQAAWRFYNNPRVTLPALARPFLAYARQILPQTCHRYGLVMHDWSTLGYNGHPSKTDRAILQHRRHRGYELQSSLLVSDQNGQPLAPLVQNLRAKTGVYTTQSEERRPRRKHLDELSARMDYLQGLQLGRPLVHIVDREGDSVGHYRQWQKQGHRFLVRAKGRQRVEHQGQSGLLSEFAQALAQKGVLGFCRKVEFKGRTADQYVAETSLVIKRAARPKDRRARRVKSSSVPGEPVTLRLVVSQVRSATGQVLATWLLLSDLDRSVSAPTLALWYYWRWRIESFFKLLKSAGHRVEDWQQENALAVARRLLIASMACVLVWQVERDPSPEGQKMRALLVRLSGRQIKRRRGCTAPALLAGAWTLLAMLDLLEQEDVHKLKHLAKGFL